MLSPLVRPPSLAKGSMPPQTAKNGVRGFRGKEFTELAHTALPHATRRQLTC